MTQRLQWDTDGLDWPHRASSRFVQAAGLRWHIQLFGEENQALPLALMLHGTGASTHSWGGLAPLLAPHLRLLSLDLPGHAFTDMPTGAKLDQLSLPGMSKAIQALLIELDLSPALVIGHSAGAAVGARMCLDGLISPQALLSINGAFLPWGGLAGQIFLPAAKLLSSLPMIPSLFSWQAKNPSVIEKLIGATGSTLDAQGQAFYGRLVRNSGHVAGALGMMASWDLPQLAQDLPHLKTPLTLIVGSNDQTVPPYQADQLIAAWPLADKAARPTLITLPGLGHLAHEERPDLVAKSVLASMRDSRDLSAK
jgi:magnesium chelatase accessory protein